MAGAVVTFAPDYGAPDVHGNAFISIQETLPAKFNSSTTLGVEIAPMTQRGQGDEVLVELND